ncbi:hypothetical protein COT62_03290 [Candidatus Roizmanbacteria bacterium CG09_land_8_20_14_0_10_41_9]|uniref:PPM-type phosphatase domain-containing protein n=1 Tax=Candidatus Roizmanbacteria bacterium CG09_land_8_20_14_0_10_41_9 TaxID=1974850 RepID=A0A2H0WS99_9BACT|nr:MAG: hypothetical protein COT62_03290 [Candidatus Roizmanbacteria bacterium CG09_land_8_20_14_0_10_41_9]
MKESKLAIYLGEQRETGFAGFVAESNFYCVLESENGLSPIQGREILKKIKDSFFIANISNGHDFDSFFSTKLKEHNLPTDISLAAGFLKGEVFYLKTIGNGEIFLLRGKQFARIISGENFASGFVEENDFYIFTSSVFSSKFAEPEQDLKKILFHKHPEEVVDELALELKSSEDTGVVALFLKFEHRLEEKILPGNRRSSLEEMYRTLRLFSVRSDRKRTFTFVILVIIFLILVWSVVMGNSRRIESQTAKKIESTKVLIEQKLAQAEEVAFLNLPRALVLISESKREVETLKKQVPSSKNSQIQNLEDYIKQKENNIMKKEEKVAEEFYDLAVDNKNADAVNVFLDEDTTAFLDTKNATVYILSLPKKSLDIYRASGIQSAAYVVLDKGKPILFGKNTGFFKVTQEGSVKKIIEKDKEWGDINNVATYNGNIYALNSGKDEIYKYIPSESGYSAKTSYFKTGQAVNLDGANSFSIDSSIYIGFKNYILKYTGGLQDGFKTSFPNENISIVKIFTSKDVEKVFALDRENSAVYILEKNGTYERQINSSIFKSARDMIVFDNAIFILLGAKLFKIPL